MTAVIVWTSAKLTTTNHFLLEKVQPGNVQITTLCLRESQSQTKPSCTVYCKQYAVTMWKILLPHHWSKGSSYIIVYTFQVPSNSLVLLFLDSAALGEKPVMTDG